MAQDFAKSRKSPAKAGNKKAPRAATRNPAGNDSHWSWFFSGLLSGLLLCVIGYYAINHLRTNSPITENAAARAPAEESTETQLDFYEYLPQAVVEVNVVPVEVANNTSQEESNPVTYLLQAGSFLDPNDAEELRARLILLNMDVRIQPTPISGRTWYRVQAGPFIGRRSVESAQNTLRENNIDPIRLRISDQ